MLGLSVWTGLAPLQALACKKGLPNPLNKTADAAYVSLSFKDDEPFYFVPRRAPFGLAPDGAANTGGFPALAGTRSRAFGALSKGCMVKKSEAVRLRTAAQARPSQMAGTAVSEKINHRHGRGPVAQVVRAHA